MADPILMRLAAWIVGQKKWRSVTPNLSGAPSGRMSRQGIASSKRAKIKAARKQRRPNA